jgi:hypothetical protein
MGHRDLIDVVTRCAPASHDSKKASAMPTVNTGLEPFLLALAVVLAIGLGSIAIFLRSIAKSLREDRKQGN